MRAHDITGAMFIVALGVASASGGCGSESTVDLDTDVRESFLTWNPSYGLQYTHTSWHTNPCSDSGSTLNRKCTNPGKDFLQFHRRFMSQLRDEYVAAGGNLGAITPWTRVPSAIKFSGSWSAFDAMKEAEILSLGTTGNRFGGLNDYGRSIENFLHSRLHPVSAEVYGEPVVGPVTTSITSTYFFKIHGLVEFLGQRFERGSFNDDEYADLFERNPTTGVNSLRLLNNSASPPPPVSVQTLMPVCGYYVGAIADFDYNGVNDLVWHGPGCNSVVVWRMGRNASGQVFHEGPDVTLPNVDGQWTLIGTGDFNADVRPDLVWKHNASLDVSVWAMTGTPSVAYLGSLTALDVPVGYTPVGVVDLFDDGAPEILLQAGSTSKTYAGLLLWYSQGTNYVNGTLGIQSTYPLTGVNHGDQFESFVGTGRFGGTAFASDLVFQRYTPGGKSFSFSISDGNGSYTNAAGATMDTSYSIQGPR